MSRPRGGPVEGSSTSRTAGAVSAEFRERLVSAGVVAIVRTADADAVEAAVDAVLAGGIRAVEITFTVPGALGVIRALARSLPRDVLLGAGTVLDADTATRAAAAGARFIVSPVLRPEVTAAARAGGAAAVPGAFTPTEILAAWDGGAGAVKLFPASALTPGFIREMKGPLPQIPLVPTGGLTPESAAAWIAAGAAAVGLGSSLLDPVAIAAGRFGELTERARRLVSAVDGARAGRPTR